MTRRGHTLIEMLVGLIIALIVGAGLFQFMRASYADEDVQANNNNAITNVRGPTDVLADHLRDAQTYSGDSYAAIKTGALSDITYYTDNTGATVRYWLSGTNLQRTDPGGTTIVAQNVTALSFTYYTMPTYNDVAGTTVTTNSHVPSAAERPLLAVIDIQVTLTAGGVSRTALTRVRLRNSPRKQTV
jgi:prepilin-type N-terminal cleavage/methylation domain-containing protein